MRPAFWTVPGTHTILKTERGAFTTTEDFQSEREGQHMTAADKYRCMIYAAVLLAVFACSSTKVTSEWKDESYLKKPGRILVLAQTNDTAQRRIMEDELVGRLKEAGTDAIAGYTVFPEGKPPRDREAIAAMVKEQGADAVFLVRHVDRKAVPEYVPGTNAPWYDFYGGFYSPYSPGFPPGGYPPGYPRVEFPGYTTVNIYDLTESDLFDGETGKLVWSASSESKIKGSDRRAIGSYASKIVKALERQELIG